MIQMPKSQNFQDDPDIILPTVVRQNIERATALHEQFIAAQGAEPVESITLQGNGAGQAQDQAQGQAQGQAQDQAQDQAQTTGGFDDAPVEVQQVQTADAATGNEASTGADNWEEKYRAAARAATGRLTQKDNVIRGLQDQLKSMQNVIANMQMQPSAPPQSAEEYALTDQERNDYGDDLIGFVRKIAAAEAASKVADVTRRVDGVTSKVQRDQGDQMLNYLAQEVPNWREINTDPNFLAWLDLPDQFSGVTRMDMLKQAHGQADAARVSRFFKGYLSQVQSADHADRQRQPSPAQPPKVSLADLAAPGRAKSPAAPGGTADKTIIRRAQISQFYSDIAAGKYVGQDQKRISLEEQIFAATREGRIR